MKKITLLSMMVLGLTMTSNAAFAQTESSSSSTSVFSKQQLFDQEGVELYSNNLEMKSYKKVGAAVATGGLSGVVGISLEYNIEPQEAAFVGFGTGQGYQTFNFGWKHNFEGIYMAPYTKVGISKWVDAGNSGNRSANSSNVLKYALSNKQIDNNDFDVNFLSGAIGLEYNQLEGDLAGVNLFGEILALTEIAEGKIIPTASVGLIYFY